MAVRKASAYSGKRARPFTRVSKTKHKAYIKVNPNNKIAKYQQGSGKDFREGKHFFMVKLIAEQGVQIRDLALEASRMFVTKMLESKFPGQFYLRLKVYPHHLLRDNKTAAGAGADRLSTGMTHSYGIIAGRVAMVKPGKEIFTVSCTTDKVARIARDSLAKVKPKIPGRTRVSFEKIEVAK
ncbi:hypothetical protein COU54_00075 [Candidatus Pacearchaeota archaeon CG10_big_fil_rev_8_21_14_0_10_31_24]|nr:MAG: hypothetical protein COU54_00075 [Candidatus Pacearchaeota archaeon CG10_big_fil_rev_8_21_14_0_10_31_24]